MHHSESIFTDDRINRLAAARNLSPLLKRRLQTLTARGGSTNPSPWVQAGFARAQRAAWEAYIDAAAAVGLFDGVHGADLL